jgi:transaldolase
MITSPDTNTSRESIDAQETQDHQQGRRSDRGTQTVKILIASVDPEELRKAKDFGIHGIITNPTIVAAAGEPWQESVRAAAETIPDGEFHLQITEDHDRHAAMRQVEAFREVLGDRLVVKACINQEMLSLIPVVQAMGHKVNITGIVTATQAYMAAQAGADYLSIYLGRAENAGIDSIDLVRKADAFIRREGFDCSIVAASLKGVAQFDEATTAGASFAACPYALLEPLIHHDATDVSILGFRKDWETMPKLQAAD